MDLEGPLIYCETESLESRVKELEALLQLQEERNHEMNHSFKKALQDLTRESQVGKLKRQNNANFRYYSCNSNNSISCTRFEERYSFYIST